MIWMDHLQVAYHAKREAQLRLAMHLSIRMMIMYFKITYSQ